MSWVHLDKVQKSCGTRVMRMWMMMVAALVLAAPALAQAPVKKEPAPMAAQTPLKKMSAAPPATAAHPETFLGQLDRYQTLIAGILALAADEAAEPKPES